jgi:hypothetical protein
MGRGQRVVTAVSVGLVAVVLLFFVVGIASEELAKWPRGSFSFGTFLVWLAAAVIPWGIFYLVRWLGDEGRPGVDGRHATVVVIAILALLFAWFVWPTPYQHIMGGKAQVNRFTGARCLGGQSCW